MSTEILSDTELLDEALTQVASLDPATTAQPDWDTQKEQIEIRAPRAEVDGW